MRLDRLKRVMSVSLGFSASGQRRIAQRRRDRMAGEFDGRHAEHRRQPVARHGKRHGAGPLPAVGCGNAVERAVWNVTLPSTFDTIWWMCPFNTVTEPKRRSSAIVCGASPVPQPHGS